MRNISVLFLIVLATFGCANASDVKLYSTWKNSVARIEIQETFSGQWEFVGTAFLAKDSSTVYTAKHCLEDVGHYRFVFPNDGIKDITGIIHNSALYDYAWVNIAPCVKSTTPFQFDRTIWPIGTTTFSIGYPDGLDNTFSKGMINSYDLNGRLSDIDRPYDYIGISNSMSPGSSGSPLFLSNGTVIGIETTKMTGSNRGDNLNFALSALRIQ